MKPQIVADMPAQNSRRSSDETKNARRPPSTQATFFSHDCCSPQRLSATTRTASPSYHIALARRSLCLTNQNNVAIRPKSGYFGPGGGSGQEDKSREQLETEFFNYWRAGVEKAGVLVFQAEKISVPIFPWKLRSAVALSIDWPFMPLCASPFARPRGLAP